MTFSILTLEGSLPSNCGFYGVIIWLRVVLKSTVLSLMTNKVCVVKRTQYKLEPHDNNSGCLMMHS